MRASIIKFIDCREELPVLLSLQSEPSTGVGIHNRRAGSVCHCVQCALVPGYVHGRIERFLNPHVNGPASQIRGGNEVIHSDLSLETGVPRLDIGRVDLVGSCFIRSEKRECCILVKLDRERISAGIGSPWVVQSDAIQGNLRSPRRDAAGVEAPL